MMGSGDLTPVEKGGNVPYGTITTLSESPLRPGLLWVGTDDGNLQLSRDSGLTWTRINSKAVRMSD